MNDAFRGTFKYLSGAHRKFEFDFRESVKKMCRRADGVVCSTEEQRADILNYCDNVHVILDIQSDTLHQTKTDYRRGKTFKIAWEGLCSNLYQMKTVGPALEALAAQDDLELDIVTDPVMPRFFGRLGKTETSQFAKTIFENAVVYPWLEESCAKIITGCDLAVIPVDLSDPFTAGKPENKLLLLWKMGMPVVTSATPAYVRSMHAAGLDHTCLDAKEWVSTLRRMIASESLRAEAAHNGFRYANDSFPEARIFELWDDMFASCGFEFRPPSRANDHLQSPT